MREDEPFFDKEMTYILNGKLVTEFDVKLSDGSILSATLKQIKPT